MAQLARAESQKGGLLLSILIDIFPPLGCSKAPFNMLSHVLGDVLVSTFIIRASRARPLGVLASSAMMRVLHASK